MNPHCAKPQLPTKKRKQHDHNVRIGKDWPRRRTAQEPVAWLDEFGNTFPLAARKPPLGWMDDHKRGWVPLYRAAPPAQPADIVNPISQQEPVAYRHSKTGQLYDLEEEVPLADGDEWAEPLYAAPVAQQEPSAWRQWSTKRHDWDYETNRGDLRPDTHADPLFVAAAQPGAIDQALQKIADFGQDQERPAPSQAKSLALLDLDSVEHIKDAIMGLLVDQNFLDSFAPLTEPELRAGIALQLREIARLRAELAEIRNTNDERNAL